MNNWKTSRTELLPDFIIGGAMKSGTSTIHNILDKHPKVFIPKKEIGFFDIDNILEHSDFNFYDEGKWITQSMDKNPEKMWSWYQSKFNGKEDLLKGEDSTTYLASKVAAKRIALQDKRIKLIFLLRQPSLRAYSNYYHLLRTGRATHSFEDTIRFNPFTIINRSLYKEQLESFYKLIPRSDIKVILFEDLIEDPKSIVKELAIFLGLDYNEFPDGIFNTHSNRTSVPKNTKLQIRRNLLLRSFGNNRYTNSLPFQFPQKENNIPLIVKAINRFHRKLNPILPNKAPQIKTETKLFLDNFFYNQLIGLDELLEKEVLSKWFNK